MRLLPLGVILQQRLMHKRRARPGQSEDGLGRLDRRELAAVAEVDRSGQAIGAVRQKDEAIDQVVDIAG